MINGAITLHRDDSGDIPERTSVVTLGVEADPKASRDVRFAHHILPDANREFNLTLAPDGRLAGAGYENVGVGAQVIGGAVHVVSLAAKLAPAMAAAMSEAVRAPAQSSDAEQLDLLRRRNTEFKDLIDGLQAQVLVVANKADTDPLPTGLADQIKSLEAALALGRAEASNVQAALKAWYALHFPDWTATFTYAIGSDELPSLPQAAESIEFDLDTLTGEAQQAARNLHTIVVHIGQEPGGQPPHMPSDSGEGSEEIVYRIPRRTQLAVYEQAHIQHGASGLQLFHLRQVIPAWVLDSRSELRKVPITSSLFGKHGATLEFGDAGTLTHLTNKYVSATGDIAGALGAAGEQVTESLEQAAKIRAALPTKQDPKIVALEAEITRRKLEAELLTAEKTIAGSTKPQ
jgi:hypothetical protein